MRWIFLIPVCFYSSCGPDKDPQEWVHTLRVMGAKVDHSVLNGESTDPLTTAFTFYALLPKDGTIQVEDLFTDPQAKYSTPATLTLTLPNENPYTDFGPLKLYTLKGSLTIPPVSAKTLQASQNLVRVRYGIQIGDGSRTERLVGDMLVVNKDSEALKFVTPDVSFAQPDGETVPFAKEIDIEATLTKHQDENVKIGWFVSSGTIQNRRAKKTIWQPKEAGEHTLCVAIYASKSRFFNFAIKKITLQ